MIEYNEKFDNSSIFPFFIKPESDPARGQLQFCHNLNVNLFKKVTARVKMNFLARKNHSRYEQTIFLFFRVGKDFQKIKSQSIERVSQQKNSPNYTVWLQTKSKLN